MRHARIASLILLFSVPALAEDIDLASKLAAIKENAKDYTYSASLESTAKPAVLVQLFTSEGCSSCPSADQWLGSLKNKKGLWEKFVPVALHVDYWDHSGWKDKFSSREFTELERAYSRRWGTTAIFTPSVVVNGEEWNGWSRDQDIQLPYSAKDIGILKIAKSGIQDFTVTFFPTVVPVEPKDKKHWVAHVAFIGFGIQSRIFDGENKGRTLKHDFIALSYKSKKMDPYGNGFRVKFNLPKSVPADRYGIVAWVNTEEEVTPLQAVGGYLS